MITLHEAGSIVPKRTAAEIATAVAEMLANLPSRAATRHHAEVFSWDATTQGQLRIFHSALARPEPR